MPRRSPSPLWGRVRVGGLAIAIVALFMAACAGSPTGGGSPTPTPTPSPTPAPGSIAGHFGYPAEGIPPMSIYAIPVGGTATRFLTVHTIRMQGTYTIVGVPPGTYRLFAIPTGGFGPPPQRFGASYTRAIACGSSSSCTDHSPIDVTVAPAQAVAGIDVNDWYAPQGAYPLVPSPFPSVTPTPSPAASYPDAEAAATFEAKRGTDALKVVTGIFSHCPVNEACIAIQEKREGVRSAYFLSQAGSNTDIVPCAIYAFMDTSGWHPLNTVCGNYPAPGKTVSASFMGSGCINVRATPGYS